MTEQSHLRWRKGIQSLEETTWVTSRGSYCECRPELVYLSAEAAQLSLPDSTYGLDVLVRIGYLRDMKRQTYAQIKAELPSHIQVSTRHVSNLYKEYQALLACADRLDMVKLQEAGVKYGGLILSVDGLQPEGGQPQLWVVRELLSGTLLAAGWLPQMDEGTMVEFLAPVKALDLPWLGMVSDKQASLVKALSTTWAELPHQYCQSHYLGNAISPMYEADSQMKTKIRKRVGGVAGPTMRKVLTQAKQKKDGSGRSRLVVTGLAANPPEELAEVKQAIQTAQTRPEQADTAPCELPQTNATDSLSCHHSSADHSPKTVANVQRSLHTELAEGTGDSGSKTVADIQRSLQGSKVHAG